MLHMKITGSQLQMSNVTTKTKRRKSYKLTTISRSCSIKITTISVQIMKRSAMDEDYLEYDRAMKKGKYCYR